MFDGASYWAVILISAWCAGEAARAGEIWFAPQAAPPASRLNRAVDFMDLFEPDAPWADAASHVKVFKLYASYLSGAPQQDIDTIVADLKRRRIAIALETGVMNVGPKATNPPCGGLGLVEGYATPQLARAISRKVKQAGGAIRYIAMDEPLWYGHYFKGRPGGQRGCRSSIGEIVEQIRAPLQVYLEEFPDVEIGDIEPTNVAEQDDWRGALSAWASGFQEATGRSLAFMHLDVPFLRPGEEGFAVDFYKYSEDLKHRHVIGSVGIIYNGTPADASDELWTEDAKRHMQALEDRDGLVPY